MTNKQVIQSNFLEALRKNQTPTSVFLTNGIQLRGLVHAFDPFVICLRNDNSFQLVYKHAVSTVMQTMPKKQDATTSKAATTTDHA
ncbi:MAG: RNA chaperone Hfq [Legionellaceae bacterium]|nr:RNA chaperone Hfq [Legionellaceae bacterium]|tara:strand:+ start:2688 stop:2945 length:258 start_codon:yes stop_codon:yes gene_type:complete